MVDVAPTSGCWLTSVGQISTFSVVETTVELAGRLVRCVKLMELYIGTCSMKGMSRDVTPHDECQSRVAGIERVASKTCWGGSTAWELS